MGILEKALIAAGLSNYDVKKYLHNGTSLLDYDSIVKNPDYTEEEIEEFKKAFQRSGNYKLNFWNGCDLVNIDGIKYIIDYCL